MIKLGSILAPMALVAGSIVSAVLLFEAYCRIVVDNGMHYHLEMWKYATQLKEISDDPAIGHRHIPGASAHLMGVDVAINDMALRDDPLGEADAGSLRVLMLGDSVTFGWGVPQDQTVSARLEAALTRSFGRPVDVINAGVGNYNTAMEVAWFQQFGESLAPDLVVLNTFINDAEPTPDYTPVAWWDRLLYSRVILFGAADTVTRTVLGGPDWESYYRDLYADTAEGWSAMADAVANLAELCRASGTPLIIVDYPELRELDPYPFADVSMKIAKLADAQDVPYISLLPAVKGYPPDALWVTPPDPHPNTFAAQLMADYLVPKLEDVFSPEP